MSRKEQGVYRGKIDPGRLRLLKGLFPELKGIRVEGSMAEGPRGSRHTDLDVSASPPSGMSEKRLRELERIIQDMTGIDFYFRDE